MNQKTQSGYNRLLLLVAGLGGLLYGIDIGIIDPALGYLGKTISMTEENKSVIVAAVLGGSMFASVIAGFFADLLGRKLMMIISAVMFVASVAIIFTSQTYVPLLLGRILQGMSGGVIAVVVPLYLAECLTAESRGKGTSIFQFMLTFGIVVAAFVGDHYTKNAEAAIQAAAGNETAIVAAANHAWRGMFLSVIYPGLLFLLGSFFISESPRWLYRKGRKDQARTALARSRTGTEVATEIAEMETALIHEHAKPKVTLIESFVEIFTRRKYIIPFILACVILGCNQATGINSVLGFMTTILQQAGLSAEAASQSGLWIKILNCVMTVVAVMLVDRKGRKFLLKLGTGGIIVSLLAGSAAFYSFESKRVDVAPQVTALVSENTLKLDVATASLGSQVTADQAVQISILYAYGEKQGIAVGLSNDPKTREISIAPADGSTESLRIIRASRGPVPTQTTGIIIAICLAFFITFFSIGPGVCVWLALSELMPTRIRSVGMGFALLVNQGVSTSIAAFFLPIVGNHGYFAMFAFWAGCTVVYFITAAFFLPETKGKTLEEIEEYFEGKKSI
ncbi:MAG: MFS transporter [Luteolibacter sp.]|uniref:MFS transporter n=1 Tax=Luteolibacter sp. TaxID=1962973 RepID=UPI003264F0A4